MSLGKGSCASRRKAGRYCTIAPTSFVDESLFGSSSTASRKSATRHGDQTQFAPTESTKKTETVRIITKDFIRELKIPSKDPSGLSIILSPEKIDEMTSRCHGIPIIKEDKLKAIRKEREEAMAAAAERKAELLQADLLREQNQPQSELEAEAQERAQYLLERANAMRMEQEDEIKQLNESILDAQCQAVRDAQILEKRQIQAELIEEEKRLDAMMEAQRRKALETQEKIDELHKLQTVRAQQLISNQMKERHEERLLQEQLKKQESEHLLRNLERMQKEELKTLQRKKEEQQRLQEEIIRNNEESLQAKEKRKEDEKLMDLKVMEYTLKKMEREAEYEAEQKNVKKEKEKQVAQLRAMQERERDYKAELDELRARRNQEAAEREWRRKEKERAERKVKEDAMLKAALLDQISHRQQLLSMEARRERAEHERVLKAQQEAMAKQQEEEEKQREKTRRQAEGIQQQVKERELQAIAQRRDFFMERDRIAEEARQRRAHLDKYKEKKLKELKAAGIPEKYCREVEQKAHIMTAVKDH